MIAFGNISLICACPTMACARLVVISFLWNGVLGAQGDYKVTAPWNVTAQEGLCVLISCEFTYEKPWWAGSPRGYWFIEGTKIKGPAVASNDGNKVIYAEARGRFRLVGDLAQRDCSLSINDVRRSDARNYYFRYEHGGYSSIKYSYHYFPVHLTVVGLLDQPEISLPQGVIEGKWMSVQCTAPGRCSGTAPEITWSSESQIEYYQSFYNTDNPDDTRTYRSTITFAASRDHNNKHLSCSVYFPAVGVSSNSGVLLNVEYPPAAPEIIQYETEGGTKTPIVLPMMMREGFDYTLACTVDSNPLSRFTWKKKESILKESASPTNTLQLPLCNVTSSDDGDYYCVANNKHGFSSSFITARVEYPPRTPKINAEEVTTTGGTRTPIASLMVMLEGFDYAVVCTVDSNPVSKLIWKKSENILEESVSSSNTLQLTFRKVSSSDDGDYYCVATNNLGSSYSFITARVEYPPRTPKINAEDVTTTDWSGKQENVSNEMIMEGRTLNMHCSVDSYPLASLAWIKGGETKLEEDDINNLTLSLSSVTFKDEGQYWCVAKNKHGVANSSVFLSVLEMESPNLQRGAIIGGVVAGLVVLAGVCLLAWMMYCRRAKDANIESSDKMEAVSDSTVIYSAINKTPKGPRTENNRCTGASTMDSKEDLYENFRRDILQYSSIHFSRAKPGSKRIPVPEETLYSEVKVH